MYLISSRLELTRTMLRNLSKPSFESSIKPFSSQRVSRDGHDLRAGHHHSPTHSSSSKFGNHLKEDPLPELNLPKKYFHAWKTRSNHLLYSSSSLTLLKFALSSSSRVFIYSICKRKKKESNSFSEKKVIQNLWFLFSQNLQQENLRTHPIF